MDFHQLGLLLCRYLQFVSLRIPKAIPDVAYHTSWDVAVSVFRHSPRLRLKLVRSPLPVAGFFFWGRIVLPFEWLPFSLAAALKSHWVFFERLPCPQYPLRWWKPINHRVWNRAGSQWGGAHATTFLAETAKGTPYWSPWAQTQLQNSS